MRTPVKIKRCAVHGSTITVRVTSAQKEALRYFKVSLTGMIRKAIEDALEDKLAGLNEHDRDTFKSWIRDKEYKTMTKSMLSYDEYMKAINDDCEAVADAVSAMFTHDKE